MAYITSSVLAALVGVLSGAYPASRAANPRGLFDLHGNVSEWCQDWYGPYPSGQVTDPTGPSTGSCRVLRGGSWYFDAHCCRAANRNSNEPGYRSHDSGFRLLVASPAVP